MLQLWSLRWNLGTAIISVPGLESDFQVLNALNPSWRERMLWMVCQSPECYSLSYTTGISPLKIYGAWEIWGCSASIREVSVDTLQQPSCTWSGWKLQKIGEGLFIKECSNGKRGHGFQLEENKFWLGIRKKFCTAMVPRHWNRWPRAVDAPFLEVFKSRLEGALSNVV